MRSSTVIYDRYFMNGYTTTTINGKGTAYSGTVGYKVYLYDPSDKEYKLLEAIRDVDTCSYQYTGNADGRIQTFTVTNGVGIVSLTLKEMKKWRRYIRDCV